MFILFSNDDSFYDYLILNIDTLIGEPVIFEEIESLIDKKGVNNFINVIDVTSKNLQHTVSASKVGNDYISHIYGTNKYKMTPNYTLEKNMV